MRGWQGKRYWIVGASAGLGRAVAAELAGRGADLILSARDREALEDVKREISGSARVVPMDVRDNDSIARAAREAGKVDGLVYLAGTYWPMAATDYDREKAETMLDVNLTGAARVLGAVLPGMVARDSGHVVLTGSLSGFRGLPGAIGYGASKAGLMSLAESLRADLQGTGVEVQLVNPGFVETRLTAKNNFAMPFIMKPEAAAKTFVRHMDGSSFSRNFPTLFSLLFRLSQCLPDAVYYRILK